MPRVLTDTDVADFRDRLCAAAERLFAEQGLDAVTMRQLAAELGVSPMTPYRYFDDKEDILAAVRAAALTRFTDALEQAKANGAAFGEAYVAFALENPASYRLIFDLNQPDAARYPALAQASDRSKAAFHGWLRDMIADGGLLGDPQTIGSMFWASAHGAVVLELSGKIAPGAAQALQRSFAETLTRGLRP